MGTTTFGPPQEALLTTDGGELEDAFDGFDAEVAYLQALVDNLAQARSLEAKVLPSSIPNWKPDHFCPRPRRTSSVCACPMSVPCRLTRLDRHVRPQVKIILAEARSEAFFKESRWDWHFLSAVPKSLRQCRSVDL